MRKNTAKEEKKPLFYSKTSYINPSPA